MHPVVIDSENIDTFVLRLSCKLRLMAKDILNFAICDETDVESTVSQYRKYMKDAVNFMSGAHLCEKFLYGSIDLDNLCSGMIDEGLNKFLITLPNLPNELVIKYKLNDGNNETEDVQQEEKEEEQNGKKL